MSKPLKVLSIAHSLHAEGSGRMRYRLLAERDDLDLMLVTPETWSDGKVNRPLAPVQPPLKIHPRPVRWSHLKGLKWYGHWYPGLSKLISEFKPDVIHLWEEPWSFVALQAMLARNKRSPTSGYVLETDQNILYKLPMPFQKIRSLTLRNSDWLIARGDEAAEVSKSCGYRGEYNLVLYCVDRDIFFPAPVPAFQRLSEDAVGLRVGYVGRLFRPKGLLTILDALRPAGKDVSFVMMGDGPMADELKQKIEAEGLTGQVEILPPRPAAEVAEFMRGLDVLILMSETTSTWKEQFGRVIIEAQACGVPVIGSDSGSIPSVIGEGGWVLKEGDSKHLGELLLNISTHRHLLADYSAKALINVERFSLKAVSDSLLYSFRATAEKAKSRSAR